MAHVTVKNVGSSAVQAGPSESTIPAPKLSLIRSGAYLLRQGMAGDSVKTLQSQLAERGFLKPGEVDGVFGGKTLAAVKAYQAKNGLEVDGLVGQQTLGALESKSWSAPAGPAPAVAQNTGFERTRRATGEVPVSQPPALGAPASLDAAAVQAAVRTAALQGSSAVSRPSLPAVQTPAAQAPAAQAPVAPSASGLDALPPQRRAELQLVLSGQAGSSSKAALSALLSSPAFGALDGAAQAQVLGGVQVGALRSSLAGISKLIESPLFGKASAADRGKLLDLANAGATDAALALGDTLFSKDSQGTRLLDSAQRLATGPVHPDLARERGAILTNVLAEAADANRILQQEKNTCSASSAAQILARSNPAELVRLVAGLATPEGKVPMASGAMLERAAGTERPDGGQRTPSQRLLQAAFMEYGNGEARYDNAHDVSVSGGQQHMGLYHEEMARLMSAVTGRPMTPQSVYQAGMLGHFGAVGRVTANVLDAVTPFHFHKTGSDIFKQLEKKAPGDTMVAMNWGGSGHVVVVDRIANGRVFFRNPQGNQVPAGQDYPPNVPPPRRSEGGVEQSMSAADFRQRLMASIN